MSGGEWDRSWRRRCLRPPELRAVGCWHSMWVRTVEPLAGFGGLHKISRGGRPSCKDKLGIVCRSTKLEEKAYAARVRMCVNTSVIAVGVCTRLACEWGVYVRIVMSLVFLLSLARLPLVF